MATKKKTTTKIVYKPKYKTESGTDFINRLNKFVSELKTQPDYKKFGDNLIIPPSVILTEMLEVYNSHWPRDLYKSINGTEKLQAIYRLFAKQEMLLSNLTIVNAKGQYGITHLIDLWMGTRYTDTDYNLDENQTAKDSIKIELKATGLFDNGNKD